MSATHHLARLAQWIDTNHLPAPYALRCDDHGLAYAEVTTLEDFTTYAEAATGLDTIAVNSGRHGRTYRISIDGATVRYHDEYAVEPVATVDFIDLAELRDLRDAEVYAQGTD